MANGLLRISSLMWGTWEGSQDSSFIPCEGGHGQAGWEGDTCSYRNNLALLCPFSARGPCGLREGWLATCR